MTGQIKKIKMNTYVGNYKNNAVGRYRTVGDPQTCREVNGIDLDIKRNKTVNDSFSFIFF